MGVVCVDVAKNLPSKDFRANAEAFKRMGSAKTAMMLHLLEHGWDVLMSDTDVAWMANPERVFDSMGALGYADGMFSSDSLSVANDYFM